jgi:hypothetical protein
VTDPQEVAVAGWTPVTDYSPYQDKLDTRWTVITDEHSQIKSLQMRLLQKWPGLSDEVLVAYHTVQENGSYVDHSVHGTVGVTTAELQYQLQGLDLPQAALVVVSLRATNHAALVSTIQTSAIRVDATVPNTTGAVVQILPDPAGPHRGVSSSTAFRGGHASRLSPVTTLRGGLTTFSDGSEGKHGSDPSGSCKEATATSASTSAATSASWRRPKLARDTGYSGCYPDPDNSLNPNSPHPVQASTTSIVVEFSGFLEDVYSGIDHYEVRGLILVIQCSV